MAGEEVEIHEKFEDGSVSIYPAVLKGPAEKHPVKGHPTRGLKGTLHKVVHLETGKALFDREEEERKKARKK